MLEKSLAEINLRALTAGRQYFASPRHWEDQVLYFLMLDRFSDGKERGGFRDLAGNVVNSGTTPLFTAGDNGNAITNQADAEKWRDAGTKFVGGTLRGVEAKLGYLQRLGVTAIWISPIFKQVAVDESYHG